MGWINDMMGLDRQRRRDSRGEGRRGGEGEEKRKRLG